MKDILIIGKKSFLGSNLKKYLSIYFNVRNSSFEEFIKNKLYLNKYSYIINTSIHQKYIKNKYNKKYDLDLNIINKLKFSNAFYIFLNTRKIYIPGENLTEKSIIFPESNYAINKYKTECFLKKKIKSKLISLRTSNIIGKRLFKNARINHKLFFDNFLEYKKNKNKITVNDDFKDFLSIKQFCKVIKKIIELKISGIYNVSISERVYISELISWLDKTSINNFEFKPMSKNSFTLSNKKLIKKIKIKLTKNQLKNYCFTLFKRN